jgi:hypothetical protein
MIIACPSRISRQTTCPDEEKPCDSTIEYVPDTLPWSSRVASNSNVRMAVPKFGLVP